MVSPASGSLALKNGSPARARPAGLRRTFVPGLLAALMLGLAPAQDGGAAPAAEPAAVTAEDVQGKLKAWSASALEAETKKAVLALGAEAEAQFLQAGQAAKEAQGFRAKAADLPARARERQQKAGEPVDPAPLAAETGVDALETELARRHEETERARLAVAEAQELPQQRANRRRDIAAIIADLNARQAQLRQDPPAPAASEAAELAEARALARAATAASTQARLDAAQAELAYYDAEAALGWTELAQTSAAAALRSAQTREEAVQEQVKRARLAAASDSVRAAALNETNAPLEARPILARVKELAARNHEVVDQHLPQAEARLQKTGGDIQYWTDLAARTREKIRRLGASGLIGAELRRQRQMLPLPAALRADREAAHAELIEVESARLDLEEELAALPPAPLEGAPATPESTARQALRDSLNELLKNYGRQFNLLIRLDEASQQYARLLESQRQFIHEQILWLPSATPAGRESATAFAASAKWLGARLADGGLWRAWWQGWQNLPDLFRIAAGACLIALGFLRRAGLRRLPIEAAHAAEPQTGFSPTARALIWTLVLALPAPLLLWTLAQPWAASADPFAVAMAEGLRRAAWIVLALGILRQLHRPNGLAEAHFGWRWETLQPLRAQVRLLLAVLPAAACLGAVFRGSDQIRHDSAERACLLAVLMAAAWWLDRLWRRARAARRARDEASGKNARLARLGLWLGHAACVSVPVLLAGLALRGYLYTAEILADRLGISLAMGVCFLLARALFFRWYTLHRRRLRSARARQLRDAREASRTAKAEAEADALAPAASSANDLAPDMLPEALNKLDIDEVGQEMRQLVEVIMAVLMAAALWVIWSDVLPAAQKLGDPPIQQFTSLGAPAPAAPAPDPASAVSSLLPPKSAAAPGDSTPSPQPARMLDILLAAAAAMLTWMAARRIPGALQFVLSSQLSLDSGLRFALGTVTRYLIIIAGTVFALRSLGLAWTHVQWLAAALTVGLGFGLQEIFANFFSGLIILFERPIRLGDVVTIDNITGTVTRIQIRATTIRTADYTEYIVPNREFITGKLLNWTLTDTTNRMTLEIGINYEADIGQALEILRQIVSSHPQIRKEPAPSISCEAFLDSSVKLVVRYYLSSLDQRLPSLTEIHCQIAREFSAAGIALPYPQRDVHVKSMPGGWEKPPASAST